MATVPAYIIQTAVIRGPGRQVDARDSKRKVRYVVERRGEDGSVENTPAVSAHHVAAIIQRHGGHFSGWDVYNYLSHRGSDPPKCAERIPPQMRIRRYTDYLADLSTPTTE